MLRRGLEGLAHRVMGSGRTQRRKERRPPPTQRPQPPAAPPPPTPQALAEPDPALCEEDAALHRRAAQALREVHDPELPVNIFDLGLFYALRVEPDGKLAAEMTLTSPACTVGASLPSQAEERLRAVEGVYDVAVEQVGDPPWTPDRLPEHVRLELGLF